MSPSETVLSTYGRWGSRGQYVCLHHWCSYKEGRRFLDHGCDGSLDLRVPVGIFNRSAAC